MAGVANCLGLIGDLGTRSRGSSMLERPIGDLALAFVFDWRDVINLSNGNRTGFHFNKCHMAPVLDANK